MLQRVGSRQLGSATEAEGTSARQGSAVRFFAQEGPLFPREMSLRIVSPVLRGDIELPVFSAAMSTSTSTGETHGIEGLRISESIRLRSFDVPVALESWTARTRHEVALRSAIRSDAERVSDLEGVHGERVGVRGRDAAVSTVARIGQRERLPLVSVIWSLVERQQVGAARQLLASLPDDGQYRALRMLLRPPRTWSGIRRDRDRSREFQWLREHAREHVGRWVAVDETRLVAVAETLRELRQQIRTAAPESRPLVHFVE